MTSGPVSLISLAGCLSEQRGEKEPVPPTQTRSGSPHAYTHNLAHTDDHLHTHSPANLHMQRRDDRMHACASHMCRQEDLRYRLAV